jgi:hypothetical protein
MEADYRRQKLDLVWASVFLAAFAMWGVTLLGASGASDVQVLALAIVCGLLLSVITVPFLLLFGSNGLGPLVVGRILVCLQLLCHIAAFALGILQAVVNS